jgi:arginyl-tRNA synthetase
VLGFLGHDVLRENHIGDWGTPFGMLIEHLLDVGRSADAESFSVRDLNEFYAQARLQFDSDPAFAERCRQRVVLLQRRRRRDAAALAIFVAESLRHNDEVYEHARRAADRRRRGGGELLQPAAARGGRRARREGPAGRERRGPVRVPEGFENRNGEPLPLIVRKSDGGYGYPATDLACMRDRTGRRGATTLVYVVGAEQSLHFRLVFAVAAWPATCPRGRAVHVAFGLILGTDGKKLASRSGDSSERLIDLLTEGVDRAAAAMAERPSDLSAERGPTWPIARHRRGQVRRSLHRARNATTSSTGTACWPSKATPALPAVRPRPDPLHLPARRNDPARPGCQRPMVGEPAGACPGHAIARLRGGGGARRPRSTARPSSAPTCSTWPPRSPPSTRPAGCWSTTRRCAPGLALCDLTARVLELGLSLLGMEAPDQM